MKKLLLAFTLLLLSAIGYAQAPSITYPGPQTYIFDQPIAPLAPNNAGGTVPGNVYATVTRVAGQLLPGSANGTGNAASFNEPSGVASDSQGNLYIADFKNSSVRKITPGGTVSTFASGIGARGVVVDALDNIYVSDFAANFIYKFNTAGVRSVYAGSGVFSMIDGPAATATFKAPAGLAIDAAGNLYIGDTNNHAIRKVDAATGLVSTLAGNGTPGYLNGTGTGARFIRPFGVSVDAAGNVYVADQGNHCIRKISPAGVVTTLAGIGGTASAGYVNGSGTDARFSEPYNVTVDDGGMVYVADSDNSVIRRIEPSGETTTLAGNLDYGAVDGVGGAANFYFPTGIYADRGGNVYVTDRGTVRRITVTGYTIDKVLPPGLAFNIRTGVITGTPTDIAPADTYTIYGFNGDGFSKTTVSIAVRNLSADATLSALVPSTSALSPAFTPANTNYVILVPNGTTSITLRPTTNDANAKLTFNGAPLTSGSTSPSVPLNVGNNTITIVVDAEDDLGRETYTVSVVRARPPLVAAPSIAYNTPMVYTRDFAIPPLTPTNSGGAVPAETYGNVTTLLTGLNRPTGIATDADGNVIVVDQGNKRVIKITPAGTFTIIADSFIDPYGVEIDPQGNIFVSDAGDNRIRKITPSGNVSYAGMGDFGNGDGTADVATFRYPSGIAIDPVSNLYVVDSQNFVIRKVSLAKDVTTFTGSGIQGFADGAPTAARFGLPLGLAMDAGGNLYTTDQQNNRIRKITPSGVVSTYSGNGTAGYANGPLASATFDQPSDIAIDAAGNMYIADAGNSKIRKITPAGEVFLLAGNGYFGNLDGLGDKASFSFPNGITADEFGHVYVSDHNNNQIRKIETNGYSITPRLSAGLVFDSKTGTIGGTPTATAAARDYTVTAYNAGGSSTTIVNIWVRPPSNDATLSNITLSDGTLSPVFNKTRVTYNASTGQPSITVTPTVSTNGATIKVNGVDVASGTASGPIPLTSGSNIITIDVLAPNLTVTKTYTIDVNQTISNNPNLTNLTLSEGTVSPVFAANTTAYTATVATGTTSIIVTPVPFSPESTILVNGVAVANGASSAPIPLVPGPNVITTRVTAENGTTVKTYTLTVTRSASADASLSSVALSNAAINPVFDKTILAYTAAVANSVSNTRLTPIATETGSTIKVNGVTVANGGTTNNISLAVGQNVITTIVTAPDGVTTQTYTVTVTRAASTNSSLSAIALSSGTLSPAFSTGTLTYTAAVSNTTTSINLTPTTSSILSTVAVNGVAVASGTASGPINLVVGPNVINTTVTAQDGVTTRTYIVTVTRAGSANANLFSLATSEGTLSPAFATATKTYTASVANNVTSVTLTSVTSDVNATIAVNGVAVADGAPSGAIPLNIGTNVINTVVTAEDGTTKNTYTVTITRAGSPNADLSALTVSTGSLTPAFSSATQAYTVTVPNTTTGITFTPAKSEANAQITVNGTPVASGAASQNIPLVVGSANQADIAVTAQDGTVKHYIVTITRQAAANADLNRIVLGAGTLSPALNPATTTYSATVTDVVSMSINLFTSDNAATILFDGVPLVSGTPAGVNLVIGNNVFNIEVTAADGITKKAYVLNITRLAATDADLSALTLSAGTLTPAFASGNVTYSAAVTNATTSITITPTKSTGTSTVRVNGTIVANATASQALPLSVGANTITVAVTAEDGTTVKTYTVTVNRAASANTNLSALALSSGTLSPVFAQATTNYAANVTNATTTIQVTPTSSDATATITVNGVAVASGSASANIPLTVGANAISTVVTAQDGTSTATYTVVVTRAASANADLSALALSAGSLSPAFASATISYTSSVSNANNSITITPTLSDPSANVQVNGTAVASGASSAPVALTVGTNNITILVTAQNGSTKTYTVTVDRSESGNADLASLNLSGGSLSPAFTAGNITYSASVNNSVSTITFTPGVGEPNATVTVNGQAVASGTASAGIPLVVGPNVVSILVTAQNGVQKTYTVTVTRQPSANANLSALALSAGALTPTFAANVTTYNIAVANAVTSTTLTPTAGAGATIKVNGTTVASGSASANIPLTIGTNTIATVVTAQDGTTTKTYTVTVTRAASANANLSALSLSAGTLSPAFAAATTSYTASVSNTNTSVTFTTTVTDPTASVKVNGTTVASGTASAPVALTVGANNIAVVVTAQNGTTKNYTVTVNRAQSANADLATLTISASTLSPVFSPGNTSYSALVGNGLNSITFTPGLSEPNATVTVNGQAVSSGSASAAIPLVVGPNVVTIVTSAQNGTNKTYTVTITREAPPASPDATLSLLTLSAGALTPTFDANVTSYNITVANTVTGTTVTPTVTVAGATIKVNGTTVASGATSAGIPLVVGSNTITTVVTAQDGVGVNVYTVTIIRQPSSVTTLSNLTASAGSLSPAFTPAGTAYVINVGNNISSTTITPTTTNTTETVTVNGTAVLSGSASSGIPLVIGANTITTIVTAQDGVTAQTYTITVNRATSSDATLAGLATSTGSLNPAFAPGAAAYTEQVSNAATSISVTPTVNDANASVTVNGNNVVSGSASNNIPLVVGTNSIAIVVTAQDGITTKTYTIDITRAPSADANLASTNLSSGTLSPAFAPGNTTYVASVGNAITSITTTPITVDPTATITVNGVAVNSGSASAQLPLVVGANTITMTVTAQDGITQKTYTITVTRAPSSNANLANLLPATGSLSPAFSANTLTYSIAVNNSVSSISFTPTLADNTASVRINGVAVANGAASAPINLIVGANTITTTVTAEDGVTVKTYTTTVTRAPSNDATLANLQTSSGTLNPVFTPGTINYSVAVANTVTSVNVTPTANDINATLTVNGNTVASGSASSSIPLIVGTNNIIVTVTAQDGNTNKTYTLNITRAPSPDANLAAIGLSTGTLTPGFASATTTYTVAVSNATTGISISPVTTEPNATLTVNGLTITSGSASALLPLRVGVNPVTTVVTAQDGVTQKTYTVTVNRAASSNANLANLVLSAGAMSPNFSPAITGYTIFVKNGVATATVTPTLADNTATIRVNGVTVANGATSQPINLTVGSNTTISTVVTAEDGVTRKTYNIIINRAFSSVDELSNLTISNGTLSPAFSSGNADYTAQVINSVTRVSFTPTVADAKATVTVNGVAVVSGSASQNVNLNLGANRILVVVTAEDRTTNTYSVTVTRAAPGNTNLAGLTLDAATLSPAFSSATTSYTAGVNGSVFGTTVTPTVADPTSTVTVNGTTVASGSASQVIVLPQGPTTITVVVTATDGTTKTYTAVVTKTFASDANLASLVLGTATLSPAFSPNVINYVSNVDNSNTYVTVTATTSDPNFRDLKVAGISVPNGSTTVGIPLNEGSNIFTVEVTAEDFVTKKTYTVNIIRAGVVLSSDATLGGLTISNGILSPAFSPAVGTYVASVPNATTGITVMPSANQGNATITVNGVAVTSGSSSATIPLVVGTNTVNTVVTAQDGSTKTYTVTITRQTPPASADANLAGIVLSAGTLTPTFTPANTSYSAQVNNSVTTITLTPTTADANATIRVNGVVVASGSASASLPLVVGANTITVAVTAQDGVSNKTYTVTVNRLAPVLSFNANLAGITLSNGTLNPTFAQATINYVAPVGNAVTAITLTPTAAEANATITVNNIAVASGAASGNIPLTVGSNTITVVVTAQDGVTVKTYTVTVNRDASADAELSNLSVSAGGLTPPFIPTTRSYAVTVVNTVTTATITPTTSSQVATVSINGVAVTSGSPSGALPLIVGVNTFSIQVVAQDGTTLTYSVAVTRQAAVVSSNADLSSLTPSTGTLDPVFAPANVNYSVALPAMATLFFISPITADRNATILVDGVAVRSGTNSAPITLNTGSNTVIIQVTAQNGAVKTYTVVVNREAPVLSSNTALGSLVISGGVLSPAFSAGVTDYTSSVPNTTASITIRPTTADSKATITVDGITVVSGTATSVNLVPGSNPITITVTAEDGSTLIYTVTVERENPVASANADLANLTTTRGVLSPAFAAATLNYTITVPYDITSLKLTPTASDGDAAITVDGQTVASGVASQTINLQAGVNTIRIVVRAVNGTTKIYTVVVTKAMSTAKLPSVFTPNGDGINDTWIIPNIEAYPTCTVKVFNRGGQMVFNSVGYGRAWDGTFGSQPLPADVYYYIIDLNNNTKPMSGSITIIK